MGNMEGGFMISVGVERLGGGLGNSFTSVLVSILGGGKGYGGRTLVGLGGGEKDVALMGQEDLM